MNVEEKKSVQPLQSCCVLGHKIVSITFQRGAHDASSSPLSVSILLIILFIVCTRLRYFMSFSPFAIIFP